MLKANMGDWSKAQQPPGAKTLTLKSDTRRGFSDYMGQAARIKEIEKEK